MTWKPPPPHPSGPQTCFPSKHRGPWVQSRPRVRLPAQQHEMAAGHPWGRRAFCLPVRPLTSPATRDLPGHPAPGPLASPGLTLPIKAPQPWPAPLSPVKSKHAHTTQPPLPSCTRGRRACRQQEQQEQRGERWAEAPGPRRTHWPQRCCPLAQPAPSPRSHPGGGVGVGAGPYRDQGPHQGQPASPTRLVWEVRRGPGGPSDSYTGQRAPRTDPSPPKRPQPGRSLHEHLLCVGPESVDGQDPRGGQSSSEVKSSPHKP